VAIKSLKVFPFNSALKRMSVLTKIIDISEKGNEWVLTKGAPEVIKRLLANVPSNYD